MSFATSRSIRDKLVRGLLPTGEPLRTWAGNGNGRACDGCDLPITTAEIEHELEFGGGLPVRFHAGCAATWRSLAANCNAT